MAKNFVEIAFTDAVKKLQEKHGSSKGYERMEKFNIVDGLTENEALLPQKEHIAKLEEEIKELKEIIKL